MAARQILLFMVAHLGRRSSAHIYSIPGSHVVLGGAPANPLLPALPQAGVNLLPVPNSGSPGSNVPPQILVPPYGAGASGHGLVPSNVFPVGALAHKAHIFPAAPPPGLPVQPLLVPQQHIQPGVAAIPYSSLKFFFTQFPPVIEGLVQRVQNYFSTYTHKPAFLVPFYTPPPTPPIVLPPATPTILTATVPSTTTAPAPAAPQPGPPVNVPDEAAAGASSPGRGIPFPTTAQPAPTTKPPARQPEPRPDTSSTAIPKPNADGGQTVGNVPTFPVRPPVPDQQEGTELSGQPARPDQEVPAVVTTAPSVPPRDERPFSTTPTPSIQGGTAPDSFLPYNPREQPRGYGLESPELPRGYDYLPPSGRRAQNQIQNSNGYNYSPPSGNSFNYPQSESFQRPQSSWHRF